MGDLYDTLRERGCIDPAFVRLSIQSQIGDGCPFATIAEAARSYGVGYEQMRLFVKGDRPPEPAILRAMGLERIELYAPIKDASHDR